MSAVRFLFFLSVFTLLGSCGGGGGGGGGSASTGAGGGSTTPTQPTNNAPSFTSVSAASVVEGTTTALTIEVSDEDSDDTIAQSITGGADEDLFELGVCNASRCTSNTLSFKAAPNFEKPQDANADNDYVVVVQATDATDPVEQTITISVTNAVEGRIVDAPLSDATVCLDTNEDSECGETEPSVTSDSQGYYAVAETSPEAGFELRVLSIGGTDILTGKQLPSLALIAEVPADPTQAVAVTPLSSVISVATDPQAVIIALGFPETVTPDELTSIDPWALATDSTESSGEFAASAELAASIGITTAELETVADNVVTTSIQIANLIQTADSVVTDTTSSGIQSAAERAAMITATVTKELVETIEAAVTAAGSASAATIDLGDSVFATEVLKETVEESATLIVAEIETKQTAGTLDLSDTNNATVAAILEIKEAQEVVTQTGLDTATLAAVTAVAKAAAEINTLIATQVATSGITVLTSTTTATAISEIVENNTTLATQLVTNEITTDEFTTQADVTTQASASGGLNDTVAALPDPVDNSSGSTDSSDSSGSGSTDSTDSSGSGSSGSTDSTDSTDSSGSGSSGSTDSTDSTDSAGSGSSGSTDSTVANQAPTFSNAGNISVAENSTAAFTASASDAEGDAVIYSISGGADSNTFSINASTGVVTFASAPDYETPTDANEDGVYEVIVTASDGTNSTTQTIQVTVADVNETVTGVLIDGYLGGATVFQDLNNNGAYDSGEPYTTSNALGNFTLTLASASPDAPVRVVNSGFDIGSNEVLTAMLDISPTSSGTYVLTPLSTLAARMMSFDSEMQKGVAEKIIADAVGVTLSDAPNTSLFGYDPIATLAGSDASAATAAQPVYAANTTLMTLGNVMGGSSNHLGTQILAAANTAIQTILDNNSLSATSAISWSDTTELTSSGHSAFMNGLAEHLTQHKAPIDAFRLKPGSITLVDYIDGSTANTHKLYPTTSGTTLTGALVNGTIDLSNLHDVVSSQKNGTAPVLQFPLNSIPADGSSGTATITIKIFDGTDTTQSSGERLIYATASVNWSSDGSTVTITAPSQNATVTYIDTSGIAIEKGFTNADSDSLTFNSGGGTKPDTLELKLTEYIANNLSAVGLNPSSYFTASNYTLEVSYTGLEIKDATDTAFSTVVAGFTLAEDPGVFAYIDDVISGEGSPKVTGNAQLTVTLSRAASSDVTMSYATSAGTATAGSDYTTTSGTLTIAAGETSGTIKVPVTNDTDAESLETFTVTLSNPNNATLARSSATVSIVDNEKFIDNTNAVADVYANALEDIRYYIQSTLKSKIKSQTLSIGGTSKTYESILADYGSVTDLDAWLKTFVDARTPGALATLTSFTNSVNTRVAAEQSGTPTANNLAVGLTKIMSGVKSIDFADIQGGTLVNNDGTFATGVTQTSFDTSVDNKVSTYATLAADTIGDPLGTDTATNFPNAAIKILTSGDDDTNGTSGSDLIATLDGNDTVNGLGGNDKILGGAGIDTFDGGDGIDHLYGFASDDSLTGGAGNDYLVGGLGDDTIAGGDGDDTIEAQTGNDVITTGAGADTVYGGLDNDTITVNGSGNKTIDGGPGTDSLTINYGSIAGISDFTIDVSDGYTSLTDSSSNIILYKNIETLVIGSASYVGVYDGVATSGSTTLNTSGNYTDPQDNWVPGGTLTQLNFGNNIISSGYYDDSNKTVYMYPYGNSQGSHLSVRALNQVGYNDSSALTIYGTAYNDLIAGQESSNSAALTIYSGDGLDVIDISGHTSADTVNAGAGDDIVHVGSGFASETSLDGGSGTDWLIILAGSSDITYTLNSGITQNFENVRTAYGADSITGDNNANILEGWGGADTLIGGDGDDELYGYVKQNPQGVTDGIDKLYGGAGADVLKGGAGDDLLDGGTGRDVLSGEGAGVLTPNGDSYNNGGVNGSDTFVTRAGDGGSSEATADVITDFEDGTDQIGLDGLTFGDLTITQGSGDYANDTIVKYGAEFLFVIQNIAASNMTYLDMTSTSTDPLTLSGSASDDVLLGGSGNDTITSGAGSDVLLGYAGDDTITINGSGNKTIDGGPGTDSLTINYGSIAGISDFTIDVSDGYTSLTDSSSNTILYKNIETLVIGSGSYVGVYDGIATSGSTTLNTSGNYTDPQDNWVPGGTLTQLNFGNNIISSGYYDDSNKTVYMYPYGNSQGSHLSVRALNQVGYNDSSALTIYGTAYNDLIAGQESSNSAALTIYSGDGLDVIDISGHTSADTVNAGAGDDIVHVGSGFASETSLDGGSGTDWLIILAGSSDITYTLNSGITQNFENVRTAYGADSITGDNNANILEGWGGADTLIGGDGDDELYGYVKQNPQGVTDGIDKLYGGAGADVLKGGAGDDLLDGGTGRDVLSGEGAGVLTPNGDSYNNGGVNGSDTFVTRAGDGGSSEATADVITDFEDGTDQIGLDGLTFGDLTITQGSGDYANDTIVKYGTEFLFVIQNIAASNMTYLDMTSTSTDPLTLSGSASDDVLLGGSGNDTITSGAGSDVLLGYAGDDTITINGSGNKTIDGGPGTDSLTINYGSIAGISDFTIDVSDGYTSLTDSSSNTILYKNIETLVIGSGSYVGVYDGIATSGSTTLNTSGNYTDPQDNWVPGGTLTQLNFGNNIISSGYYDDSNKTVYMYPYGNSQGSHLSVRALNQVGYNDSSALTIYGTAYNDLIAGQESSNSAALTIYSGDGLDVIDISGHTSADTVNAGAGDDIVHVGSGFASETSLDGGSGTDWLIILAGSSDITYTLNSGITQNFENVRTAYGADSITGDNNANILEGWGGADTLIGGDGDDELYGYVKQNPQGVTDGIDKLYGGAGADVLKGGAGDDLLDGGTGRDVLSGEGAGVLTPNGDSYNNGGVNGSDTFVTRAGDGGSSEATADVITDFEDGTDLIGLDGLTFGDLTITQGSGDYANDTIVKYGAEFLFVIQNIAASNMTSPDFTPL